jgi:hypothetical protein
MRFWFLSIAVLALQPAIGSCQQQMRPPAVPLVACDPYFSIWSPSNQLAESNTTHWTGREHRLQSCVTIDGKKWRLLGAEPGTVTPMLQTGVRVLPTRTICEFETSTVALTVTFTTPALPESIDLLSWPVTYVTYSARSLDGQPHSVVVEFEANGEIAVNDVSNQRVVWSRPEIEGLSTLAFGSETQAILNRSGDDLRIDWGYCYLSVPSSQKPQWNDNQLLLDLGSVGKTPVTQWLLLAYDDIFSIQYMGQNLRPYWRKNGWQAADLLKSAMARYAELSGRCKAFDEELIADLTSIGGTRYAELCGLCYRQCLAAGKFVADKNGQPLQFSKENHSNGCIATSDVFYPMAPQFLMFGPSLTKSFLVPFMNYAASDRWKFPFAPHDLGQYPLANGQVYGGGERTEENQMPVEECGNLLLLLAATAQMEGTPAFANSYWKQVEQWAAYLMKEGFDPANQLCTDDFAGHMAHNVNLSVKAICAIGAYGKLCQMRGDAAEADRAFATAREFAQRWMKEADDGDHYRLAFDRKGSWSQKYNLVWDRILDLKVFPPAVAEKEMSFYRRHQNPYGLALDNRETYSKLDWIVWTATLTENQNDFEALIDPVIAFINETPDRSPLTDWYQTKSSRKVGFTARPVVGGVFVKALYDKAMWTKWASRNETKAENWAVIPKRPVITQIVPVAAKQQSEWRYTTEQPDKNWFHTDFNVANWKSGTSGFGTKDTPGVTIGTEWNSSDIWLVRDIDLTGAPLQDLQLMIHHDEDVEIYINGQLTEKLAGYVVQYEFRPLSSATRQHLKSGPNRIAVHCHQERGGQYIDLGFAIVDTSE